MALICLYLVLVLNLPCKSIKRLTTMPSYLNCPGQKCSIPMHINILISISVTPHSPAPSGQKGLRCLHFMRNILQNRMKAHPSHSQIFLTKLDTGKVERGTSGRVANLIKQPCCFLWNSRALTARVIKWRPTYAEMTVTRCQGSIGFLFIRLLWKRKRSFYERASSTICT